MKKAYLAIGYQNRRKLQTEVEAMQKILIDFGIRLFIFVDTYHFSVNEEQQMMQQAFREIDSADMLIAEVSEKAIGVGIEIGYATAKNKPVIYLRNTASEHSTTASGSAAHSICYKDTPELTEKLIQVFSGK
jgi:nucleoside 2-deoxyribosyltransferase